MNGLMDNLVNYGDILLSCSIKHDMHMEHRMPAHSIIFVRSGKLIIEGRDSTDEITADNFVFVRRDCSINVTKVPLDGTPYRGINFTLPRRYLKEYYNRIAATCRKMRGISPIGQTVNILPQTTGLKSLFGSFMPYRQRRDAIRRMAAAESGRSHNVPAEHRPAVLSHIIRL